MLFQFTPAEDKVILGLRDGLGDREIARRMRVSTSTMKQCLLSIARKLDIPANGNKFEVRNRIVYILAYKEGLLTTWPCPCCETVIIQPLPYEHQDPTEAYKPPIR